MSVSDALQLMFMFGTFIVALLALVVELIKSQQKSNHFNFRRLRLLN
ncbi:putative holin-like toxin [Leuconostoc citreum]